MVIGGLHAGREHHSRLDFIGFSKPMRKKFATKIFNELINKTKDVSVASLGDLEASLVDQPQQWRRERNERVYAFCKLDDYSYSVSSAQIFNDMMWETAWKGTWLIELVKSQSSDANLARQVGSPNHPKPVTVFDQHQRSPGRRRHNKIHAHAA